jgi:arylsulfatase A-like enzyme
MNSPVKHMKKLTALSVLLLAAWTSFAAPAKPNIVYLLVDDMGFADCGFNGSKEIHTPNIDALAAKGTVFENYYVQPLCSAARACFLTARLPIHHGIYGALKVQSKFGLPLEERTLPQALHTAGYTTAICGKWHLGEFEPAYRPRQRGFDHQYGLWYGQIDYFTHERGGRVDWYRDDKPLDEPGYSTQLIAKEAVRLIHEQPKDKPLFLYVPFNAVHGPFQVTENYVEPYKGMRPTRATMAGMLAAADEAIGQIVDALKTTHMDTNTLIIFSSDNGGVQPGVRTMNTPLRDGKGTIYEGGVRSAAFAVWPGNIPAGKKTAPPVQLADWYPTLVKLTGADASQPLPVDGLDIMPLLMEGAAPDREALLIVGTSPNRMAIRMGDWKLLVNPNHPPRGRRADPDEEEDNDVTVRPGDVIELYNLAEDISETKNLASSQPERVKAMRAKMELLKKGMLPPANARGQAE